MTAARPRKMRNGFMPGIQPKTFACDKRKRCGAEMRSEPKAKRQLCPTGRLGVSACVQTKNRAPLAPGFAFLNCLGSSKDRDSVEARPGGRDRGIGKRLHGAVARNIDQVVPSTRRQTVLVLDGVNEAVPGEERSGEGARVVTRIENRDLSGLLSLGNFEVGKRGRDHLAIAM